MVKLVSVPDKQEATLTLMKTINLDIHMSRNGWQVPKWGNVFIRPFLNNIYSLVFQIVHKRPCCATSSCLIKFHYVFNLDINETTLKMNED